MSKFSGLVSQENLSIVAVGVTASSHAAAVVRVGASCGQGVGNGFTVVHSCPWLVPTARRAVHSQWTTEGKGRSQNADPSRSDTNKHSQNNPAVQVDVPQSYATLDYLPFG